MSPPRQPSAGQCSKRQPANGLWLPRSPTRELAGVGGDLLHRAGQRDSGRPRAAAQRIAVDDRLVGAAAHCDAAVTNTRAGAFLVHSAMALPVDLEQLVHHERQLRYSALTNCDADEISGFNDQPDDGQAAGLRIGEAQSEYRLCSAVGAAMASSAAVKPDRRTARCAWIPLRRMCSRSTEIASLPGQRCAWTWVAAAPPPRCG